MARPKKRYNWLGAMRRYGDGSEPSLRQVCVEFGIPEASARDFQPWPRDYLAHQVHVLQLKARNLDQELAELMVLIEQDRQRRAMKPE